MAIVIFGDSFSFPEGRAATNRVYTYAKGLIESGINVHVICFLNDYIEDNEGIKDGIKYYHPFGQTKRNKSFVIRRCLKFIKYFNAFKLLRELNKEEKLSVIHLYSYNFIVQFFCFITSRLLNTRMTLERGEHPLQKFKTKIIESTIGELKIFLEMKMCDGIYCISDYLVDFYKIRGFNEQRLLLVPSTVEPQRFNVRSISPLPYSYVLYCGGLTILKDGVNILIESFIKISDKHPDVNLVIIGKPDEEHEEVVLKDLVKSRNANQRVIFIGQLSRDIIPSYLVNAKVLALARPRSRIADAGFPSKVTEYLAAGKPVIVTKIGEIPKYLKDNENAFLSEPDSVDAFAEKLDYVLGNYDIAKMVGSEGQKLTGNIFNYNFQSKRIIAFVDSLMV